MPPQLIPNDCSMNGLPDRQENEPLGSLLDLEERLRSVVRQGGVRCPEESSSHQARLLSEEAW